MNDYRTPPELVAALRTLAARDSVAAPPPELEARLRAEFAAAHDVERAFSPQYRLSSRHAPARSVRAPSAKALAWTAAAASVLLAGAALLDHPRPQQPVAEAPFVQVPYVAPPAPYERTEIIRQNVPVAALIAAGFEVHVADSGAVIPADILIGQDGRTLAIRLVPVPDSQSERSLD